MYDLHALTKQWLGPPDGVANLNGDDSIDIRDFALLAVHWRETGSSLVINEVLASNNNIIQDTQHEYEDYIEIYNTGGTPIDVGGMYITDDLSEPTKWQVPDDRPSQTTIPGQGYLLIWADNDIADPGLHANFKLDADGEEVGLYDRERVLIDSIIFGKQTTDISYGRYPDAGDQLRFFSTPTPGAENSDAYIGMIKALHFSHERGFYDAPFELSITSSTTDVDIYYTLDGSVPIENHTRSETGILYTGPIAIGSNTSVRAAALKTGWMPTHIDTHTYIFDANDIIKAMPVVCLVGDNEKTFYEPDGIMAYPTQRGRAYERPVSLEIIDIFRGISLQDDCGIRVHGSDYTRPRYTRGDDWLTCWIDWWPNWNSNKFSFNLWFRSDYGGNRLEYDFFPFINVARFKSIVLRAGHNDACTPFVKDEWARRLFREMGRVQLTGTFANLYINGEYKAYYNPSARLDEEFLQEWYNTGNNFDVITQSGVRNGDSIAWDNLINYANSHNLSNTADFEYVASKLDIPTFIDFLIIEIHIGNFDWPGNNWDVHCERSDNGIFRFSIWDAEGLAEAWYFDTNCENCADTAFEDFPTWAGGNKGLNHFSDPISQFYRALKANIEYRQLFADHVHKHFRNHGILTEEHLLAKWWEVIAEVNDVLPETQAYPVRFVPDTFIPLRERYTLAAFEENDLFNLSFGYPIFHVNNIYQHGGAISANDTITITQSNPSGTLYYAIDGNDPRMPASTHVVSEASVLVSQDASKTVLVPSGNIGTSWRGGHEPFDDSSWISGSGSVGYERGFGYEDLIDIDVENGMYNRNGSCYIRIPFTLTAEQLGNLNALSLKVSYDDGFVAYINGTEVKRVNFNGTPQWNSRASGSNEASGLTPYDLSAYISDLKAGNNILAIQGLNTNTTSSDFLIIAQLEIPGTIIETAPQLNPDAITYTGGFTLNKSTYLKSRIYNSNTQQWSPLNEAVFAVGPVLENLRITEIMYHPPDTGNPEDPNKEYIELMNIGTGAINLNLVKFTDGIDFTFGDIELAPGGLVLLVKDKSTYIKQYPLFSGLIAGQYTGSLNNAGERITLEDAIGRTIVSFRFRDNWFNLTDGQGFSLTIKDPNIPIQDLENKDSWQASLPNPGEL